jgi:O-antigen/teichoic acid export membrane protein
VDIPIVITALLVLGFFASVAWFLAEDVFKSRGDKSLAYALHIAGGLLVLITGPFQFIAPIRSRYRRYHRIAGYAFVGGSAAAIAGFFMILPVDLDVFLVSQLAAISLWAGCVAAALVAIRRKRVLTHRHNMALHS